SPRISGGRLRGLRLSTLFHGRRKKEAHLEGAFYYPAGGYGRIATELAAGCAPETVRTGARVTRLVHDTRRILYVEVNGRERIPVDQVAGTLPLGLSVGLFDPALPADIVKLAQSVRFRNVVLAVWFLDRPSVMPYATVYFPGAAVPFTRVFEPRNRSSTMSPPGKTSLVAEIPCESADEIWQADDETIVRMAEPPLAALGWVQPDIVLGTRIVRLPHAYPVLTLEAERAAATIVSYLARFENLHLLGRNGLFHYGWLHSVLRMAKNLVSTLPERQVHLDTAERV
ncbi:MAG: FAD-dependent oxidoreductase, partial [Acidobacteriota bacterium]